MANINWWTVGLLVISNLIMLYAWYGHLRSMGGAPFSIVVMKQPISWNYAAAAVCIFGAEYFIFRG